MVDAQALAAGISLEFVLLLIGGLALDFALVAWFRRLKQGKFRVTLDAPDLYRFETDLGVFSIDRKHERFNFATENRQSHWPLGDISEIKFESRAKCAFLEELFFGFELTDLMEAYKDTIDYFVVYVQARDGRRLPVFAARQYKPRDFLAGWYIELQEIVLGRLGLFINGYKWSRAAYRTLWHAFVDSGAAVSAV